PTNQGGDPGDEPDHDPGDGRAAHPVPHRQRDGPESVDEQERPAMLSIVLGAGGPARAEDEKREHAEEDVGEVAQGSSKFEVRMKNEERGASEFVIRTSNFESLSYVRYRTSMTLRTTSFAAPGRFCTRVSTSLKACDSPPCLKHSAQRGRLVKSRRSNAACICVRRSPSMISRSDWVRRSPIT